MSPEASESPQVRHNPPFAYRNDVGNGSWLRDNALTPPATVHDPVNVVPHGRSENFFVLDDQALPLSHRGECWARSGSGSARNWVSPLTL
jgi:hypothetical protein